MRLTFFILVAFFCVAQAPAPAPAPAPVPAPAKAITPAAAAPKEVPKVTSAKNAEFSLPFSYDFSRDHLVLLPVEFEYDLTKDGGSTLTMGKIVINQSQFNFSLGKLSQFYPASGDSTEVLLIRWPEYLLGNVSFEMISRGGRVLWKQEISTQDLKAWKTRYLSWKSDRVSTIGIMNPSEKGAPLASVDEPFRFCLTQGEGLNMSRLCSDQHIVQKSKEGRHLARQAVKTAMRVFLQNQEAPPKKLVLVDRKKLVQFYADLTSGISYEFVTRPPKANISDISKTPTANLFRVVGWDVFPMAPHRIINEPIYPEWVKKWGFEPTIRDERKFWETGVRGENPVVYFPGEGGGVFRQKINFANIPPDESRSFLRTDTTKATYWDSVPLFIRRNGDVKLESKEFSVEPTEKDPPNPSLMTWNLKATEKGEINKSHLTSTYQGKSYLGYYDVYRAFANELSGRFTGVYSDGNILALAELAYNFWLESIFGNSNRYLSFQRWGFSGKYFKSLTPLPINAEGEKGNLDVSVFDIKYRLSPGVWTRDETVGIIASHQNFKFEELSAAMMGIGAFWARSMPAIFDKWFNQFPMMNYPKWVDMEFIMYVQPLQSNISLGSTYSLNFHGQVLWSKTLFGEAGFGLKRYEFTDNSRAERAALNTLYGTLGLGIKF